MDESVLKARRVILLFQSHFISRACVYLKHYIHVQLRFSLLLLRTCLHRAWPPTPVWAICLLMLPQWCHCECCYGACVAEGNRASSSWSSCQCLDDACDLQTLEDCLSSSTFVSLGYLHKEVEELNVITRPSDITAENPHGGWRRGMRTKWNEFVFSMVLLADSDPELFVSRSFCCSDKMMCRRDWNQNWISGWAFFFF